MSNWSETCAKMVKTLCDVTDYDDSDLPLLGVKADIDGSFENDFLRGHAVNKYNKLVPYKESGVTKDDIEKECATWPRGGEHEDGVHQDPGALGQTRRLDVPGAP